MDEVHSFTARKRLHDDAPIARIIYTAAHINAARQRKLRLLEVTSCAPKWFVVVARADKVIHVIAHGAGQISLVDSGGLRPAEGMANAMRKIRAWHQNMLGYSRNAAAECAAQQSADYFVCVHRCP